MSRMQRSQVQMWRRGGKKRFRKGCWMYSVMDCISKEEPSPSTHPSSSKPPHPRSPSASVASVLNLYFKEEDTTLHEMLPFSR